MGHCRKWREPVISQPVRNIRDIKTPAIKADKNGIFRDLLHECREGRCFLTDITKKILLHLQLPALKYPRPIRMTGLPKIPRVSISTNRNDSGEKRPDVRSVSGWAAPFRAVLSRQIATGSCSSTSSTLRADGRYFLIRAISAAFYNPSISAVQILQDQPPHQRQVMIKQGMNIRSAMPDTWCRRPGTDNIILPS